MLRDAPRRFSHQYAWNRPWNDWLNSFGIPCSRDANVIRELFEHQFQCYRNDRGRARVALSPRDAVVLNASQIQTWTLWNVYIKYLLANCPRFLAILEYGGWSVAPSAWLEELGIEDRGRLVAKSSEDS